MLVYKKVSPAHLIVLLWVMLTLGFALTPVIESTLVKMVLVLPTMLFIPGYMLLSVLFPKSSELGAARRTVLSFGISMVIVPLMGILLNLVFGIKFASILIVLSLYTAALVSIGAYRRGKQPEDKRFPISPRSYGTPAGGTSAPGRRRDAALALLLIFIVASAAGMVYFVISPPVTGERFTEFYILDPSGKAESYPSDLKYDSPVTFPVGVTNHEYSFVNYTVQVALDKNILTYTKFMLDHNETWRNNITFVPGKEGKDMKLEFWLFKDDNSTVPYRELQLWVSGVK